MSVEGELELVQLGPQCTPFGQNIPSTVRLLHPAYSSVLSTLSQRTVRPSITWLVENTNVSGTHVNPSPLNPSLQVQVKPPTVSPHVALASQPCVPLAHSSMFEHVTSSPS